MKKFVPAIGVSDFRKLRESDYGFVDKSYFVSEVLNDSSEVLLFPRPRRFGKTLNLSMLDYFVRKREENLLHLFDGLMVTRDARAMKHFQKYPTIFITFKDVKARTVSDATQDIRSRIAAVFDEHRYLFDSDRVSPQTRQMFQQVLQPDVTLNELKYAFQWLSQALHAFYGERVIILIDEYDTPLHAAYLNGYFDELVTFFKTFLSTCLKDNRSLQKAVLTGILRVAKENMFSDLNHISVWSILDEKYVTAFGFTDSEVAGIVDGEHLDNVRIVYRDLFQGLLTKWDPSAEKTTLLVKGLLSGDAQMIQDQLQWISVSAMSYHDTSGREPEKLYHGIVLGMLVHLDKQYEIRSNREAGFG